MNMNPKNQRTLRYKTPVLLLSIISLVFTVLGCTTYFLDYTWNFWNDNIPYDLAFHLPSVFELISFLLDIAPCVLFLLYIIKFYNDFKATFIIPLIFGLIAVTPLTYYIRDIIFKYNIFLGNLHYDIFIIVTFVLAAISALKGFSKKIFLIIAITTGLIVEFLVTINLFKTISWYIENGLYYSIFTRSSYIIGTTTFYIALLLFGLKNRIPALLSTSPKKEPSGKADPEQALMLLKDKLDFGMITEEEYQAQRAEIIRKL